MRRLRSGLASICAALIVATTACAYHHDSALVPLANPGRCVPVDIAATPDTAALLTAAASHFNGSSAARMSGGACAFVRVEKVDSPVAARELVADWPDAARLGPAPVAWVPGSTAWSELVNARLTGRHRRAIARNGTPFARTPLVIAMPVVMARALGYPRRAIGWADLEQLAGDPRGWAAYGHPEWGLFRLGRGNPHWSTTGLDAAIALDASSSGAGTPGLGAARRLERSVVYYADAQVYLDNWRRLAKRSTTSALTYLSAAVTDERSVVAYDRGHEVDDVALTGHGTRPALPLVAIYPKDGAVESDNPIVVLDAPWSSVAAQRGAGLFAKFAREPATQANVAAAGFRPVVGAARTDLISAADGVDPEARANPVPSPAGIETALTRWQADRRAARVLVLFDVSDSMGDRSDPLRPHSPTKLALARTALAGALDELAPGDEVGLRIFSTDLAGAKGGNWLDVVPIGPFADRRPALRTAIRSLETHRGSPLYSATRDAADAVASAAEPGRINAVVVLTDGYNEDEHDNNVKALLAHLASRPDVRVFTITYSGDADLDTLDKIAQATNAWNFDAHQARDLADVLPRALASF